MGRIVITGIMLCIVIIFPTRLISGRRITKDCRALSVRYQRLARRADCNATAIAASGIAAYIRVVYKQPACVRRGIRIALDEDAASAPVKARHAAVVSDVDFAAWSVVVVWSVANHRVNHLAHSDAGTFRSVAHVRGNNSSRNVEPCHILARTASPLIGNVNAATGFFRIIASNLATGNGDMGAVIGSKPSATVVTAAIFAAEFSHSIIRDVTAGNSNASAYGHNTAAIASLIVCPIECRVARNDSVFRNRNVRVSRVHAGALGGVVCSDNTTGQIKGRSIAIRINHNARALALRGSTANVATAHIDGRAVLGIDETADIAALFLRKRTALKVKLAALIDVNELQCGILGRS